MRHKHFLVVVLGLSLAACDQASVDDDIATQQVPEPFANFVVYVADGVWNPADPNVPVPTLEQAQRDYWGFDDADIQQYEAEAQAFFAERFGIAVTDPALAERILLMPFGCDPRLGYRVVSMAGRSVPAEGWPVCDAGYLLTVTDPAGLELGGEWAGVTAPVGTSMAIGRYHIQADGDETFTVAFKSLAPYVTDPFGASTIRCDVDSPELGSGEANLVFKLDQTPSGEFAVMIRNVLTFD